MRMSTMMVLAAGLPICLGAAALATDVQVPLNYNFNGMVHAGEQGVPDSLGPSLYRSIADRGMLVDGDPGGGGAPPAFGAAPIVGATGMPYTIVSAGAMLDIVMLGNRNLNNPYELTAPGANPNVGIAPDWPGYAFDQRGPQVTTLATPVTLDAYAEIGLLYHISNVGTGTSSFTVTLGFSDAPALTVTVNGRDWFNGRPPLAPAPSSGLSIQAQLGVFKGAQAADQGAPAPATASLNAWEAVIDVHQVLLAGLGDYAGKHLTSITFQYPTVIPPGNRDYAIFAATVRTDVPPPANDNCSGAIVVTAGDNPGTNVRATGSTTSACGVNDTTDVWYRYTATTTGTLEARTCGAIFDTTITIFQTCGGAAIACDNDGCGTASRVQWQGVSGQTYFIRVAGNGQTNGPFTLHIDDPVPTVVPVALNWNFNGMTHGATEQGIQNRDNLNGFRSISDRALLVTGTGTSINAGPIIDPESMTFTVVSQPLVLDCVHLGDRNLVDNGTAAWGSNANTGLQPTWLPNSSQIDPQVSDVSSLHAVFTANARVGILYQISNGGGAFDVLLSFTDNTSALVTLRGPDWFGATTPPPPGPGVAAQRRIGVYAGTQQIDIAAAGADLTVVEGVISVASLLAGGFGNFEGKELASITFQNPVSANPAFPNPAVGSGFAIIAASLMGVNVPPACYANCDRSTQPPVLNVNDFVCFQSAFAAGLPYADCNNSGTLNVLDFVCFQSAFAAGCR